VLDLEQRKIEFKTLLKSIDGQRRFKSLHHGEEDVEKITVLGTREQIFHEVVGKSEFHGELFESEGDEVNLLGIAFENFGGLSLHLVNVFGGVEIRDGGKAESLKLVKDTNKFVLELSSVVSVVLEDQQKGHSEHVVTEHSFSELLVEGVETEDLTEGRLSHGSFSSRSRSSFNGILLHGGNLRDEKEGFGHEVQKVGMNAEQILLGMFRDNLVEFVSQRVHQGLEGQTSQFFDVEVLLVGGFGSGGGGGVSSSSKVHCYV